MVLDFCYSNAVLEHIPLSEFSDYFVELRRVMRCNAIAIHRVDLKDHLGGSLNNLRFTERVWEGNFFRESGFYTNRLRFSEMIETFVSAGFDCEVTRKARWETLPVSRSRLAPSFSGLPDEELKISGFDVKLTCAE